MSWASVAGFCYRAVDVGREALVLDGSALAGRYNRPGERSLYTSGSPAGIVAAMARYGVADRLVLRLMMKAERLIDLRDPAACLAHGIDASRVNEDWIAALESGAEPASWGASDRARALGACGLIDGSRRAPGEWHLVLFSWNVASGADVRVAGPAQA